jgi:hypothetical protein
MSISEKAAKVVTNNYGRSVVPFTGPIFAVWAFFDPNGFGRWFGTVVHAFRTAAAL